MITFAAIAVTGAVLFVASLGGLLWLALHGDDSAHAMPVPPADVPAWLPRGGPEVHPDVLAAIRAMSEGDGRG